MTYHTFQPADAEPFGSFETFHMTTHDVMREWCADDGGYCVPCELYSDVATVNAPAELAGWYWWACFPGCLPDGEPAGPFETEEAAIEAANQC
jgi:hypothetical protein